MELAKKPEAEFWILKATPANLSANWAFVREGLLKVKQNSPTVTWVPEQIRRAIERGFIEPTGCELFFCWEGGKPVGFYVMLPQFDPWLSCNMVWLCWIFYSATHGLLDRALPVVKEQAKERGYWAIDYVTALPGLVKHMSLHGFQQTQAICRLELEY